MRLVTTLVATLAALSLLAARPAPAADAPPEIPLAVEKSRFIPSEVKVKASTPFVLVITNKTSAPVEFESKELRVEKVIPAGQTVRVRMRALKAGTYAFFDDFHKETAGRIVVE